MYATFAVCTVPLQHFCDSVTLILACIIIIIMIIIIKYVEARKNRTKVLVPLLSLLVVVSLKRPTLTSKIRWHEQRGRQSDARQRAVVVIRVNSEYFEIVYVIRQWDC